MLFWVLIHTCAYTSCIPQLEGLLAFNTSNIVQLYLHTTLLSLVSDTLAELKIVGHPDSRLSQRWPLMACNLFKKIQGLLLAKAVVKAITPHRQQGRIQDFLRWGFYYSNARAKSFKPRSLSSKPRPFSCVVWSCRSNGYCQGKPAFFFFFFF